MNRDKSEFFKNFSELLEINDVLHISYFRVKFNDKYLETEYLKNLLQIKRNIRIIVSFFAFFFMLMQGLSSLSSRINPTLFIFNNTIMIIPLFIIIFSHFIVKNLKLKIILSFAFSITITGISAYSSIFTFFCFKDEKKGIQIRELYAFGIITIMEILYSYEYNFVLFIFLLSFNVGITVIITIANIGIDDERYKDIIVFIFMIILSIYLKRMNSILLRNNFLHNFKLNKFFSYCYDLINNMENMQFTLKNQNILLYNETYKKNLIDSTISKKLIKIFHKEFNQTFTNKNLNILSIRNNEKAKSGEGDENININSTTKPINIFHKKECDNIKQSIKNKYIKIIEKFRSFKTNFINSIDQLSPSENNQIYKNNKYLGQDSSSNYYNESSLDRKHNVPINKTYEDQNNNSLVINHSNKVNDHKSKSIGEKEKIKLLNSNHQQNSNNIFDNKKFNTNSLEKCSIPLEEEIIITNQIKDFYNKGIFSFINGDVDNNNIDIKREEAINSLNSEKFAEEKFYKNLNKNCKNNPETSNKVKKYNEMANGKSIKISNCSKVDHQQYSIQSFYSQLFPFIIKELSEIYFLNLKPKNLNPEYSYLKADNLLEIINNIRDNKRLLCNNSKEYKEKEKTIYDGNINYEKNLLMNKEDNENFKFLGDFYNEKDKKYFQVFFRKHSEYKDIIDFLVNDFTKLKEAEEKEFYLKTKFFAKIAHEFKTPINSIIGLIKNLKKDVYENKFKRNFKKIISNGINKCNFKHTSNKNKNINFKLNQIENLSNYIIFLINDIIQYSNIYTKMDQYGYLLNEDNLVKMPVNLEDINLREITEFSRDVLETLLISKEKENYVKIKYEFEEKILNYKILSDEFRMKQMILNLISNAVKFTKSGTITISCSLEDNKKNSKNYVRISIIDTGLGIKEKDLNNLIEFKENNRISSSFNYNQEGSGLGLCITKYLADNLNHKMEIQSKYGKGSIFSIIVDADKINSFSLCEIKIKNSRSLKLEKFENLSHDEKTNKLNNKKSLNNHKFNQNDDSEIYLSADDLPCKESSIFNDSCNYNDQIKNQNFHVYKNCTTNKILLSKKINISEKQNYRINQNQTNNNRKSLHRKIDFFKSFNKSLESGTNIDLDRKNSSIRDSNNRIINSNLSGNKSNTTKTISHNLPFVKIKSQTSEYNYPYSDKEFDKKPSILAFKNPDLTCGDSTPEEEIKKINNLNFNVKNNSEEYYQFSKIQSREKGNINICVRDRTREENEKEILHLNESSEDNYYSIYNTFNKQYHKNFTKIYKKNLNIEYDNNVSLKSYNNNEDIGNKNSKNSNINLSATSVYPNNTFHLNNKIANPKSQKNSKGPKSNKTDNLINSKIIYSCPYYKNWMNPQATQPKEESILQLDKATPPGYMKKQENINNNSISFNNMNKAKNFLKRSKKTFDTNKIKIINNNININSFKQLSKNQNKIFTQENEDKNIILIVDDHLYVRQSLRNLLTKILKKKNLMNKFIIKEGRDGIDLIYNVIYDQFANNKIKLIITDENMEFLNGSEAIQIVRKLEKNNKIKPVKIASITAFEDELMKKLIKETGVNIILSKPCDEASLKNCLEELYIFDS